MFIPTLYTGKGKLIAFLPQSLNHPLGWSNSKQQYVRKEGSLVIAAYWLEFKAGKQIACFGVITPLLHGEVETSYAEGLELPSGTTSKNAGYSDLLQLKKTESNRKRNNPTVAFTSDISFVAAHKLGNSRAYNSDLSGYFPELESFYDESLLISLLGSTSNSPPQGTDGWYKWANI